jgi:hypothetical protein
MIVSHVCSALLAFTDRKQIREDTGHAQLRNSLLSKGLAAGLIFGAVNETLHDLNYLQAERVRLWPHGIIRSWRDAGGLTAKQCDYGP